LSKQRPQPGGKDLGLSEEFQISLEAKLTVLKSLFERIDKLAAKDFLQHFLGKKVVVSWTNPAGVIKWEAAGRNDTMDMGMNFELLTPSVQHAEETNLCAKMPRIASHFEKGFRTGTEQKAVEDLLVL
jgi:hypothetical protein